MNVRVFDDEDAMSPYIIWFDEAATDWKTRALAIGNGRIGGMIFSGITQDRIHFNEDSLWYGGIRLRTYFWLVLGARGCCHFTPVKRPLFCKSVA